jgi:hypothetical protein
MSPRSLPIHALPHGSLPVGSVFGDISDRIVIDPVKVVVQYLVDEGLFSDPVSKSDWPVYAGFLPDDDKVKDDAAGVFETTPVIDSEPMMGGIDLHYGVQMRVRSLTRTSGRVKAENALQVMTRVLNATVAVGSDTFTIACFKASSGIISLGKEPEGKGRFNHTLNFLLAITET